MSKISRNELNNKASKVAVTLHSLLHLRQLLKIVDGLFPLYEVSYLVNLMQHITQIFIPNW